jgi:hypothetical protein
MNYLQIMDYTGDTDTTLWFDQDSNLSRTTLDQMSANRFDFDLFQNNSELTITDMQVYNLLDIQSTGNNNSYVVDGVLGNQVTVGIYPENENWTYTNDLFMNDLDVTTLTTDMATFMNKSNNSPGSAIAEDHNWLKGDVIITNSRVVNAEFAGDVWIALPPINFLLTPEGTSTVLWIVIPAAIAGGIIALWFIDKKTGKISPALKKVGNKFKR